MGCCDNEGATHHTGCECHEARRDAEIERLKAEAARLKEHLRHIAYEHCDSPVHYAMNQLEDE